ncbi:unnamed protein product, partial [Sphacelaria rigidula]
FAIGRCRALPLTSTEALPDDKNGDGSGKGGDGSQAADPAREILATIGADNAGKYLVSTQDEDLRARLRKVPGCPLLFVSRTVLLMEQPSGKSKTEFEKAERKKNVGTTEEEDRVLGVLKRREREEKLRERASQPRKRLKKKASAPNPLSCKRSKAAGQDGGGNPAAGGKILKASSAETEKRRRKRKKSTSG